MQAVSPPRSSVTQGYLSVILRYRGPDIRVIAELQPLSCLHAAAGASVTVEVCKITDRFHLLLCRLLWWTQLQIKRKLLRCGRAARAHIWSAQPPRPACYCDQHNSISRISCVPIFLSQRSNMRVWLSLYAQEGQIKLVQVAERSHMLQQTVMTTRDSPAA
jgi:hypothetical protein